MNDMKEVEAVADAIDGARYQHPDNPRERPRPFSEADRSDREYAIRLARAALSAALMHQSEGRGALREFIAGQRAKLETIPANRAWKNGYGEALKSIETVVEVVLALPPPQAGERSADKLWRYLNGYDITDFDKRVDGWDAHYWNRRSGR